jgi:hypothetical protein
VARLAARPRRRSLLLRKQNRLWLLVNKELHLQQLSIAVAVLWAAGCVAAARWRPGAVQSLASATDAITFVTVFYSALVAMLVGALASAEERQLGTLQMAALASGDQVDAVGIKVATAVILALTLAVGVPAALAAGGLALENGPFLVPEFAIAVLAVTVGSLYVSSRSSSGMRALMTAMAALVAAQLVLGTVASSRGFMSL